MRKVWVALIATVVICGVFFCRSFIAEGALRIVAGKSCTVGSLRWEGRKCILENLAMDGISIRETIFEIGKRKVVLRNLDLELSKAKMTGKRWGLDFEVQGGRLHHAGRVLPFSVEPSTLKHHLGTVRFGKRDVIIDLFSQSKEIYTRMTFEKCSLENYGALLSHYTSLGNLSSGEVSGHLAIGIYRKKMLDHLAADLRFKDVTGKIEDYSFASESGDLQISMPLDAPGELPLVKINWKTILSEFNVRGKVMDGGVSGEKGWKVSHFTGEIDGTERCFPKIKGEGVLEEERDRLPFKFSSVGEVGIESHVQLSVDLGQHEHRSHIDLSVGYGKRAVQFACDFENLTFPELRIAQKWFDHELPLTLSGGNLSGSVHGVTEKGKILSCRWGKVHLEEGIGTLFGGDFSAEKIELSGEYHPGNEPTLAVEIENGWWRGHDEELDVAHSHIRLDEGIFEKSFFIGKTRGIDAEISVTGTFHEVNTTGSFAFDSEHRLSQYLCDRHDLSRLVAVHLSGVAFDLHEGWRGDGKLEITYENEITDTIDFRCSKYKCEDVTAAYWKTIEVMFNAENLSHFTYGHIMPEESEFNIHGEIDLAAEVTQNHIEITAHPKNVTAMTRDLHLTLTDAVTEPFHFRYDKASEKLSGGGFLLGIKARQTDLDLDFTDICGEVMIKDSILEIQELQGLTNHLFMSGYLVCDMRQCKEKDVQISIDRVQGDASDLLAFLRHFDDLHDLNLPLQGDVSAAGPCWLSIQGKEGEKLTTKSAFDVTVNDGVYTFNDHLHINHFNFGLHWDSEQNLIEISNVEGNVAATKGENPHDYHFSAKYLRSKNPLAFEWDFDLRISNAMCDLIRLKGKSEKDELGIALDLAKDHSHFFGAKLATETCVIDHNCLPIALKLSSESQASELLRGLTFLARGGILPVKESLLVLAGHDHTLEGRIVYDLDFDKSKKMFKLKAKGEDVVFQGVATPLAAAVAIDGKQMVLSECYFGQWRAIGTCYKSEKGWAIPMFESRWRDCHISIASGELDFEEKKVDLDLRTASFDLAQIKTLLRDIESDELVGKAIFSGNVSAKFDEAWKIENIGATLSASGDQVGTAALHCTTREKFDLSWKPGSDLIAENFKVKCAQTRDSNTCGELDIAALTYTFEDRHITGKSARALLPPELVLYLTEKKGFTLSELPIAWENQLEGEFDFAYRDATFNAHGRMKEGYYWFGDHSWLLSDFAFNFSGDRLRLTSSVKLDQFIFDISASALFGNEISGQFSVSESVEKGKDIATPLTLFYRWNKKEIPVVQAVEGTLYGLTFDFHHNPRVYLPHQLILTGSVTVDSIDLLDLFPQGLKKRLEEIEIGRGYELSGDLILSTKDLLDYRFKGFLRGRDFEFAGYELKTLLSEIDIAPTQLFLHDFRLSDESGVAAIRELRCHYEHEKGWVLNIPEITLSDFRPSLLKQVGKPRGSIKPFIIKDLHFNRIGGTLGDTTSFTGRGYLDFLNTFKRDFNLFDIPFDIIGRLGLDLGLFVPVRGKLDYTMENGKISLNSLTNSYSDGERSQFYLSEKKPAYISLDGTLNIDMKMKQYVLLKITEPFTLSIRGSLMKPRYHLK